MDGASGGFLAPFVEPELVMGFPPAAGQIHQHLGHKFGLGVGWVVFSDKKDLPDGSLYAHPGKLNFVSAQIDPATDSLTVRAEFPNPLPQSQQVTLIPGQYVPLRLTVGKNPDALLIPEPALVESQIGNQVYVVGNDNKVESRTVAVGKSYQHQRIITKGLKKDEKVIVEGTQKVRPGVVVNAKAYTSKKLKAKNE